MTALFVGHSSAFLMNSLLKLLKTNGFLVCSRYGKETSTTNSETTNQRTERGRYYADAIRSADTSLASEFLHSLDTSKGYR